MNESQAGADFSRYILDRMRQLEERNLALREQKDRVEGEKRLIENQKLKFEREARKLKREKAAYKAAGLHEDETAVNIRLRRLNAKYKAFSAAAGLPEQRERMKVLY